MILGICECGCGKNINIRTNNGYLKRYEWGHNRLFKTGKDNPNWKRGKWLNYSGYVYTKEGREHRLVMEKYIGRKLKPNEVIHHINGDKTDNRIENLELIKSHSEHMRLHNPKKT